MQQVEDLSDVAVKMAQPPVRQGVDDLNDVRMAIGALCNSHRDLVQRVEAVIDGLDDVNALMHRVAAFSAFLDDVEAFGDRVPALLRSLATDPMVAMFAGPVVKAADEWETFMAQRKAARSGAPAIERQG